MIQKILFVAAVTSGCFLSLAGCSSTTSASDDGDSSSSVRSSSSVQSGTSSSAGSTSSTTVYSSDSESTDSLGVVSDLASAQNAAGEWLLTWAYSEGSLEEDGFAIDKFDDAENAWEAFDSVGVSTYRYVFADDASGTFRVSAYNGKLHSAYSDEVTIVDDLSLTDLSAPTALTASRLAPSVWLLSWSYTTTVDRQESGFILEKYSAEAEEWIPVDTLNQDVNRVVLDSVVKGVDQSLGTYRVAAYDDVGRSDYSNDVSVTIQTEYDSDITFSAPTDLVPNVVDPTVLEIVIPTNPMNKSVEQSEYTASLSYEIIWILGDEEEDPVTFSYTKNSVTVAVTSAQLCNSYGRIRLVWTDANGVTDYSEWSDPAGSKPGTNSSLVDYKDSPNCPQL